MVRLSEEEAARIGLEKKPKKRGAGKKRGPKQPKKRRNKYGNKITEVDGIKFHSKAEAQAWGDLRAREKSGEIKNLTRQVRYDLIVNGMKVTHYTCDFRYFDVKLGRIIVADKKSFITKQDRAYQLRKKLMLACLGIEITEF